MATIEIVVRDTSDAVRAAVVRAAAELSRVPSVTAVSISVAGDIRLTYQIRDAGWTDRLRTLGYDALAHLFESEPVLRAELMSLAGAECL